jgi:hypothetical protein
MTTVSSLKYLETLPDPDYGVNYAGLEDNDPSFKGQPFKAIQLKAVQPTESDRTISGKLIYRNKSYNKWDIGITYNPMTVEEFEPIQRFLMQRRGRLNPFKVSLPQYKYPQDSAFKASVSTVEPLTENTPYKAGSTAIDISHTAWTVPNVYSAGLPKVGDVFTVQAEAYDSLHTKVYIITRVETTRDVINTPGLPVSEYKEGTKPLDLQARIHFSPGLQRDITESTSLKFNEPQFTVVQAKDTTEYNLNTEGLYSFSLRLEEAFY